jgi:hypothetical protein
MTGDQEQPEDVEELVQTTDRGTNIIQGKVTGTVVQLGYVNGDFVFPGPQSVED